MAQPLPYERDFDFAGFQSTHPSTPLPGDKVNLELDQIAYTTDEIRERIRILQRDDLQLANQCVGWDQLKPELRNGFSTPTVWAVGVSYSLGAAVYVGRKVYAALVAHKSVNFGVDLAAGKWYLLADFTAVTQVDQTAVEAAQQAVAAATAANSSALAAAQTVAQSAANAQAAQNSAIAAAASQTAAAVSASDAATSASNASASATAAANSAADAATAGATAGAAAAISEINSQKNVAGGLASLDGSGYVPLTQLQLVRDRATHFGGEYDVHFTDYASAGTDNQIFTAALAALQAKPYGGRLLLPAGTISLTGPRHELTKDPSKWFTIGGQGGGTIVNIAGVDDTALYIGSNSGVGAVNTEVRDILFTGASKTLKTAVRLDNANVARFQNVKFRNMRVGVMSSDSFAVRMHGCFWSACGGYGFVSLTAAHNLVIDNGSNFFDCGRADTGAAVYFTAATDNAVIRDSDFEQCRISALFAAGGTSLIFEGNYSEYNEGNIIDFTGEMIGASIANNWLALGTNGGETWTVRNMSGGQFKRNRVFNQNISFAASCKDVDSGDNSPSGSSIIGRVPYNAMPTLTNGWTAGARTPGYTRRGGRVFWRGLVSGGTSGAVATTIPVGYRPAQDCRFTVAGFGTASALVIIDATNGNMAITPASGTEANLDSISYPVA